MRKVSLLCLLGLIATAPVMSVAETKPNGETEVYSDAITMVVEELGANEQFNVTKFLEEIDKVITGGQTLTQKRVFDACFESYTSTKSGMDKVTEITNFCTDFDAKLVKAQAKVQKDMEDRIRQAKQFAAEGDAKPILYHSKGGANERYGVYKTKYGYAVYTTKTKNNGKLGVNDAKEFVCFLGDEGTENCNTNKSCVASSSVKSSKYGVVFVCGNSANNYASLKDGFSVYKNNRDGAVFSQYALMAQTGMDQLELIKNNAIKEIQGKEEQAAVVQELQECPTGTKRPSEAAAACLEGICKLNIQECYLNAQVDCYEAAARKEPANWTGAVCSCGNTHNWNEKEARCEEKQLSNFEKWLAAHPGASNERIACYKGGKWTKWEGADSVANIENCKCIVPETKAIDSNKVWDGKSCIDRPKTQAELDQEKCERYVAQGMTKWNEQTKKCDCTDPTKSWNGDYCLDNGTNCSANVSMASQKRVVLTSDKLDFVNPNAQLYKTLTANVNKYNNALARLKQLVPEKQNTADCNIIKDGTLISDIDTANTLVANIESNVERFKEFNKNGIRFWTRSYGESGEPKYMTSQQDMTLDAIYQTWHTIANTNGYDAHMYNGTVDYTMAGEGDKKLEFYFGSRPSCDLDRRSNIVKCTLQTKQSSPVIMRFSYAIFSPEE